MDERIQNEMGTAGWMLRSGLEGAPPGRERDGRDACWVGVGGMDAALSSMDTDVYSLLAMAGEGMRRRLNGRRGVGARGERGGGKEDTRVADGGESEDASGTGRLAYKLEIRSGGAAPAGLNAETAGARRSSAVRAQAGGRRQRRQGEMRADHGWMRGTGRVWPLAGHNLRLMAPARPGRGRQAQAGARAPRGSGPPSPHAASCGRPLARCLPIAGCCDMPVTDCDA